MLNPGSVSGFGLASFATFAVKTLPRSDPEFPPGAIPVADGSIRFDRGEKSLPDGSVGVGKNAFVVAELPQKVGLDEKVIIGMPGLGTASVTASEGPLPGQLSSDKLGIHSGILLVGGSKDGPIPQIQEKHFGLICAKDRDQRSAALGCRNVSHFRLPENINDVVIAQHTILTAGKEVLTFIRYN